MNKPTKQVIRVLVFLASGLGILIWIFRRQDKMYREDCGLRNIAPGDCNLWAKLQADFLSVDPGWILLVLIAFMISNLSRAHRWQMLLRGAEMKVGYGNTFWTIMLGYAANLAIPRIGEILRGSLLSRYEKIPVEKVLGTIVVDRAVDVVSLLFAIFLAFVLEFDKLYAFLAINVSDSRLASPTWWTIATVGIALLIVSWILRKRIAATGMYSRVAFVVSGFVEGLKSIRNVDNLLLFLVHTVIIWLMYYAMTYLAFFAFEPTAHLGAVEALMAFVFGGLGVVFPSPGGMGTYHLMIMAALDVYSISGNDAFSFANIVYFSVNLFCNILFGLAGLAILPLINRKNAAAG